MSPDIDENLGLKAILWALVLSILLAVALGAQPHVMELSGIVYGTGDAPLEGVTVEVRSEALRWTAITRADGKFQICCLTDRPVEMVFTHRLATHAGVFSIQLTSGGKIQFIAVLKPGGEEWELQQPSPPQETLDEPTRTYTEEDIAELPSTLHLWSLVGHTDVSTTIERFDVAGMHGYETPLFGSRGESWSQNRVVLNGFTITSEDGRRTPLLPDLSSLASVRLETGSERISPSGAVLSLDPRTGRSAVHGEASFFYQGGALQSVNVTPRLRSFGITESDERYRYYGRSNAQLGGPISSNWVYYGSASRLQTDKWIRNHGSPVSSVVHTGTIHVSGHPSLRNRIGLLWIGQRSRQPQEGATPQVAPEATRNANRRFQSFQGSWTYISSTGSLLDARAALSMGSENAAFQPGTGLLSREERFPGSVDIPFVPSAENGKSIVRLLDRVWTGAAPLATDLRDRRFEGRVQLSTLRTGIASSLHRVTLGVDQEWFQSDAQAHAFQDHALRFFRGSPDSVVYFKAADAQTHGGRVDAYAGDHIGVGALALSFSGQTTWEWGRNRTADSTGVDHLHWRSLGAHAGVLYRLGERYPTVFQVSGALRHQEALLRALDAVDPGGLGVSTYSWNDLNHDGNFQTDERDRLLKVEGRPFTTLDSRVKQPFVRDVHLGVSQTLPGGFTFRWEAFRRVDHQLLELTNTGVPESAFEPIDVFDPGDDGATQTGDESVRVAFNQDLATLGQDAYRVVNPPNANAFSEGWEAHAVRKGEKLEWDLAFTQYRAVARTPPGNGPLQNDWGMLAVVNDPNQSVHAYGSTYFDRGLGARFHGTWRPGWKARLTWITSYLDGAPFGRILPVTGLNQGLIGILATRRGPGDGSSNEGKRTAYNLTTDVRLSRRFHFDVGQLDATLDVFNVFNIANALSESEITSPTHLWRIPLRFQTPRSLQLGLRFTW